MENKYITTIQNNINPIVQSPFVPYNISLYQDKYSLMDTDVYIDFIKNSVSRFRRSRFYKNYKAYLMGLGMYRCQFNSNITSDMADIEMHHNVLTIFDIAVILCEYTLATKSMISTYDLIDLMKKVHKENKVQVVMLSLTAHQQFHNANGMFIHPDMCFGDWISFLYEYKEGLTIDIINKVINYINMAVKYGKSEDHDLLKLRDTMVNWGEILI